MISMSRPKYLVVWGGLRVSHQNDLKRRVAETILALLARTLFLRLQFGILMVICKANNQVATGG